MLIGRRPLRHRDDGERGAVVVEAAIILPVLLMITFGLLELGLAFRNALSLSASARAGARTASAQPRQTNYHLNTADSVRGALLDAVPVDAIRYLTIYKANSTTGNPVDGGFESCTTCYRFTWNESTRSWDPVAGSAWPAASQSACGGTSDTDFIGIYIRIEHSFLTGFFGRSMTLTDHSVMRLEPIPSNEVCKP